MGDPTKFNYQVLPMQTPEGINYHQISIKSLFELDVCQGCGKKLTTCNLSCPPEYICPDCFPNGKPRGF